MIPRNEIKIVRRNVPYALEDNAPRGTVLRTVVGWTGAALLIGACITLIFYANLYSKNSPVKLKAEAPVVEAQDPPQRAPVVESPVVAAQDVLQDFGDNKIRAKQLYRGTIRVKGQVTGFVGNIVLLETLPAMSCFGLSSDERSSLNRGDIVTVEGRISLGNAGGVYLRSCKLK